MSESNDHGSDSGSDLNWPLESQIERQHHDQVVFENVADQYVKGEDVTAFLPLWKTSRSTHTAIILDCYE